MRRHGIIPLLLACLALVPSAIAEPPRPALAPGRTILSALLADNTKPPPPPPFEFGNRPANSIFDPSAALPTAHVAEVAAKLEPARAKEGLDVVVVVLKSFDGAEPIQLAQRFAEAWSNPLFHSVVIFAPGENGGPWIVPGGKLLRLFSPEAVRDSVAQAQRRSACELTDADKIRAATSEAVEMLRIWAGDGAYWTPQRNAELQHRQPASPLDALAGTFQQPSATAWVVLVVSLLLAAGFLTIRRFARRHRRFPEPSWQTRFGAPYSGGNGATTRI